MRKTYVVAYDVCDQKRLRRVFKKMRGFGDHVQYSVFRCDLSDQERNLMIEALWDLIKHDEDQVLIFDIGPSDGRADGAVRMLGKAKPPPEHKARII